MNENKVLLEVALEDLRSSILLYSNKFYPQSIFYFQQSAEKAVKYVGISNNVIQKTDLNNKIGHNTNKIFKKVLKDFFSKIPTSESGYIDVDEQYGLIQNFIRNNNIETVIPELFEQINIFRGEMPVLPFDYTKTSTPKELYDIYKQLPFEKIELEKFEQFLKNVLFKQILLEKSKAFVNLFPDYIKSILVLFVISTFTHEHVTSSRYPNIDSMVNPNKIYNSDSSLIISMRFFLDNLLYSLKSIFEFETIMEK
jgi:HEPN domain-containing protein